MNETPSNVPTIIPKRGAPVAVSGTWDAARNWLQHAERFEQAKLFCQVMVGFELTALHKTLGVQHGKAVNSSHDGKSWSDIIHKETGLSQSTAYRLMEMAKAAAIRLRKLPALQGLDLLTRPLSALSEPQSKALNIAVKKLTDGKTQAELQMELGLYKCDPGTNAGRKPGDGGRPPRLSIPESHALAVEVAHKDWAELDRMAECYGIKFCLLADSEVEAQLGILDKMVLARRTWLKQPANNRQPAVIDSLLKPQSNRR